MSDNINNNGTTPNPIPPNVTTTTDNTGAVDAKTNIVSIKEWKQQNSTTKTEAVSRSKSKKPKSLLAKNISTVEQAKRASQATSYLLEMYADVIKLSCAALAEIERTTTQPVVAKIARSTIGTVAKIINQVAIDLQTPSDDDNDKSPKSST